MKHIPLLAKENADPEVKKAWEAMGFDLALFHVTAHASNTFLKWAAFNGTVWQEEVDGFPLPLKEMAVVDGRASETTLTAMSEKYSSKQLTQLIYGICTYMMNSRLANLGGCEIGDDEDFGMFSLGRKT